MTDPVTPGAVDKIINLGDFWNEEGIAANKTEIIDLNEECSRWYRIAYNYLNAAKSVYRSLEEAYNSAIEASEIYKVVADIIAREYKEYEISLRPGKVKRFFASAITANGTVHYLNSLLENMNKVYMINVPVGHSNRSFMDILAEGAIYRGLDIETYYCAMCPEEKIEHIVIPQLKLAFVTVNEYHDLEPWEISGEDGEDQDIILIDMNDFMDSMIIEKNRELAEALRTEFDILLNKTVKCLGKAKNTHLMVEDMYIPNMNFTQIGNLAETVLEELKNMK